MPRPRGKSDYLLVVSANFTHGRAGAVSASADGASVTGAGAGLRTRTQHRLAGATAFPSNASAIPAGSAYITASLGGGTVALATDPAETTASVAAKTAAYRAAERATIAPYGKQWAGLGNVKLGSILKDVSRGSLKIVTFPAFQSLQAIRVRAQHAIE